jgi:hypothetical protein
MALWAQVRAAYKGVKDSAALATELPQSQLGVLLLAWVKQVGVRASAPGIGAVWWGSCKPGRSSRTTRLAGCGGVSLSPSSLWGGVTGVCGLGAGPGRGPHLHKRMCGGVSGLGAGPGRGPHLHKRMCAAGAARGQAGGCAEVCPAGAGEAGGSPGGSWEAAGGCRGGQGGAHMCCSALHVIVGHRARLPGTRMAEQLWVRRSGVAGIHPEIKSCSIVASTA